MQATIDIGQHIKKQLEHISFAPEPFDYGIVTQSADGVVSVRGVNDARYGELIAFENDAYGLAMHLDTDNMRVAMLNGTPAVGSLCRGTGRAMQVPVGEPLLGRIVDPVGRSLFGELPEITRFRPVESPAPGIMDRSKVSKALETGILALDAMIPIGCGQRELIIGDRQTGKTTIATDIILNQKDKNVLCVYCAIGQKASTVAEIIDTFTKAGAMAYTVIVASTASDSAALQYLAPYTACAIGEEFMYTGHDTLVVYDDLSKHAVSYRTISLLLHRPPGREAYPGDVFYLHSRLLERSAQLSEALGGGSMTALPIIETMSGDISAYIPTNVISITDGQIFLESELFRAGVRPAVNVGLSVSRVGRSAQHPAMRTVSGTLRLELAQYRELSIFAQFGSDLDASTKAQLDSGVRLMELLKQRQHYAYPLSAETVLLLAYKNGILNALAVKDVQSFIAAMLNDLAVSQSAQMRRIDRRKELDQRAINILVPAMKEFAASWKKI